MDNIPKYIECKHGREKPFYLHPSLEPILSDTHGVMTYQEDVMLIARELAGYSLGQADELRRAMGKKIKEQMAAHRARFIEGAAKKKGIDAAYRRTNLRPSRKIRGLRLQQGPRRGLRASRLSNRLAEGELRRRVLLRLDDARYLVRPTASRSSARKPSAWASPWRRPTSTPRARCSPPASAPTAPMSSTTRCRRSAMSGARRWNMWSPCARRAANSKACSTSPAASTQNSSTAASSKT